MPGTSEYDSRLFAGADHFNRGDFFEAHEVWEGLWHETPGPDRRFIQGLIQAAVALHHAGNGNARGARRLFHSARKYMSNFANPHLGIDVEGFWAAMEKAMADFLPDPASPEAILQVDFVPRIVLE